MLTNRLLTLRKKKGISQQEISKRLGVARTTYASYEQGTREPDIETLHKLANFFEEDLNWLITGERKEDNLDEQKRILLERFDKLSDADQQVILELSERLKKE